MTLETLFTKHSISTLDELELLLVKASNAYYNSGTVLIPDAEYDILFDHLSQFKPTAKIVTQVRSKPADNKKKEVKLPFPMPSMNKAHFNNGSFDKWLLKYYPTYRDFSVTDKLDGVSVQIVWSNNAYKMYVGGDAETGFDVSHLVGHVHLPPIPKGYGAVRAELIMEKAEFACNWSDKYKNSRNLVSGIVNKAKGIHEAATSINAVVFDVMHKRMTTKDALEYALSLGFTVVNHKLMRDITENQIFDFLREREQKGNYLIDGLIVTLHDVHELTTDNPKYSVAFKAPSLGNYATTEVLDIEWKPSRIGKIIPTLLLKSVELAGVTVSRASGFNAKFITENKIGKGAVVSIIRSGEVIPDVQDVITPALVTSAPDKQLVGEYKWDDNKTHYILLDRTLNNESNISAIASFFSQGLKIKGISSGIIRALYNAGYKSINDILAITAEQIEKIDGFAESSSENIFNLIRSSKQNADIITCMAYSGFFNGMIGTSRIKAAFEWDMRLSDPYYVINIDEIGTVSKIETQIAGFSDKTAKIFVHGIKEFAKWIITTDIVFAPLEQKKQAAGNKLEGQNICFTGFRDKVAEEFVVTEGGLIVGGVNSKTTMLVCKDTSSVSSKMQKAQELGIEVLSKDEFTKRFSL